MNVIFPEDFPLAKLIDFADERGFDVYLNLNGGGLMVRERGQDPKPTAKVIPFRGKTA